MRYTTLLFILINTYVSHCQSDEICSCEFEQQNTLDYSWQNSYSASLDLESSVTKTYLIVSPQELFFPKNSNHTSTGKKPTSPKGKKSVGLLRSFSNDEIKAIRKKHRKKMKRIWKKNYGKISTRKKSKKYRGKCPSFFVIK